MQWIVILLRFPQASLDFNQEFFAVFGQGNAELLGEGEGFLAEVVGGEDTTKCVVTRYPVWQF